MCLSSLFPVRWHFSILFTHQKPCMSDEMSHVNPSENGTLEMAHPASSALNGLTVLDLAGSVSPHPSCRLHCHTVNRTANWTKPARREAHAGIKQEARHSYCYLKKKMFTSTYPCLLEVHVVWQPQENQCTQWHGFLALIIGYWLNLHRVGLWKHIIT